MDLDYGGLSPDYVDQIRNLEGFNPNAYADGAQTSIGYGTKARFPGERIDKAEGDRRLSAELGNAAKYVDGLGIQMPAGTRAALTSLTYNAGPAWINSGLGAAVRNGDWDVAKQHMLQYAHSGGQFNQGLLNRRHQEVSWMGQGDPSTALAFNDQSQSDASNAPAFTAMKRAMRPQQQEQGNAMPSQKEPSLYSRVLAGGPGALFGAPGGVFPGADGSADGGYDLGLALGRAGAALTSIGNPSGGAAMMNAANAPLFRQRYSVVSDKFGQQHIFDVRTGQIVQQTGGGHNNRVPTTAGAGGVQQQPQDTSETLANMPTSLAKRGELEQEGTAKQLDEMRERSEAAKRLQDRATEMLQLTDDPNVSFGGFSEQKQKLKNVVQGLTGYDPGGTAQGASYDKNGQQMVREYLSGAKGARFAGPEISYAQSALPTLDKPRDTNKQILQDIVRNAQMDRDAYDIGLRHYKTSGVLGPKFREELNQHFNVTPTSKADAVQPSTARSYPKGVKSIEVIQ
jgi:GH24 family phage-related lysozyme (muramidase)